MSAHVVAFGAYSAIAVEVLRRYALEGAKLYLIGRDERKLSELQLDLEARGAQIVGSCAVDLDDTNQHARLIADSLTQLGKIDMALLAHGKLGDQQQQELSYATQEALYRTNVLSPLSLLTELAAVVSRQGSGTLCVISSVAGDRGRKSNYIYGSTKAALTAYTDGLRGRLLSTGAHVITVKPGFVDTPMTAHLKKGPLAAPAAKVGQAIYAGIKARRDVIYAPGFWYFIMYVIKLIPERMMKRLNF